MGLVNVEVHGGVAQVTLDDPDRRNAISRRMNGELVAAIDEIEGRTDIGALVLTGAGRAFCAGADLAELEQSSTHAEMHEIYSGFLRIAHARVPTVAAVNGPAVGAGMNMALACDVILAGRSARFDTRFLQIGIHPGGGHTWRLRRITDHQTVMAMVVFGETLDGEGAERHGLAWRCLDDAELLEAAHRLAARAATYPRDLVRRTKATVVELSRVGDSDAAVAHELAPQLWSMGQPAFRDLVSRLRREITSD
jgi:enoyl-CoA hydratase